MNEIETNIWAAGFLDGEGCFALTKSGNKGVHVTTRTAVVHVCQIKKAPLERLAAAYGGNVRVMRTNKKGQVIYQWALTGKRVAPLIEATLPYLAGKQDEAQAVLDYVNTIGERGGDMYHRRPLRIARRRRIIQRHEDARVS